MDVIRNQKRVPHARRYLLAGLAGIALLFLIRFLWFLGQSEISISRDTLVFAHVQSGDFTVSVRGSGVLAPDNVQWLSANVEANVVNRAVKAGSIVKAGDLIVELRNPELMQQLMEAQWEFEAQDAEAKADKVAQELALLEQKAEVINAELAYESSTLKYNAETELSRTGAVSKLVYQTTTLETAQLRQRWEISQAKYQKMLENILAQDNVRRSRLNIAKQRLQRTQEQVDDLKVRATMDSVVLEMPLEPGQRIMPGANIAKLAQQDSLIAELQVPEIQISDVAAGQKVIVDTRNNKIEGRVLRIDPAVVNGKVQVDVRLTEALPADARPDLSVDGEIRITEVAGTLYVERPLFTQSRSQSKVYRLSQDGQFAERIDVSFGYGSVSQIQIANGLHAGDRIITSDPARFGSHDRIRIN